MCEFASFFHKPDVDGKPEICVWDLNSHAETEEKLNLNLSIWQEGHYTPEGKIELRFNDNFRFDKAKYTEIFKTRFKTFKDFLKWACTQEIGGSLYLSGCDLRGITLPKKTGGYLYLSGCNLKGITLPKKIGGALYLSGCDLRGITLPKKIRIIK